MIVSFEVLGEPQGKGRPRTVKNGNFVRTYTPEKTVSYENLVKLEYERQCGERFPDDEPLKMTVLAYYKIPKSTSKKKKEQMLKDIIRPTKKPDMDNVLKIIADSLNDIAYRDDTQIVDAIVRKYYSDAPKVIVTIETAWKKGALYD